MERTVFRSWVLTSHCPLSCLQRSRIKLLPHQAAREDSTKFVVLTLVSIVVIVGVLLASGVIYCLRHNSHYRLKEKLSGAIRKTKNTLPIDIDAEVPLNRSRQQAAN